MNPQEAYLALLKRALNGYLVLGGASAFDEFCPLNRDLYDLERYEWKIPDYARPHTLLTDVRLDTVQTLMRRAIDEGVAGDFIEAGAHRGGAVIFMRAFLEIYGIPRRKVWVADSFEGIPAPRKTGGREDIVDKWSDRWVAGFDVVRDNFMRYGLLDSRVQFLKGYFVDTLPTAPIRSLALIRLDADSYESTMDALTHLYPKLSPGGYVIIDDHHLPGCMDAVADYRSAHRIVEPMQGVFRAPRRTPEEVFWQAGRRKRTMRAA
jgi:hypothetical protein